MRNNNQGQVAMPVTILLVLAPVVLSVLGTAWLVNYFASRITAKARAEEFLKQVKEMHQEDRELAIAQFSKKYPEAAVFIKRCPCHCFWIG